MLSNFKTFLKEKIKLNDDTYYFRFFLINPKQINFTAGQYVILKINDKTRLYSIASSEKEKEYFDLLVKIIPNGFASNYFLNLKINDEVNFAGIAGFFNLKKNKNQKIFLATSTGVAPFLSMIRSQNYNFESKYFLFWGLRYKKDVYFLEELNKIKEKSKKNFDYKICLSQEKNIEDENKNFVKGRINVGLENFFKKDDYQNSDFYICGSNDFVEQTRIYLEKNNVKKEKIFFERYGAFKEKF